MKTHRDGIADRPSGMTRTERVLLEQVAATLAGLCLGTGRTASADAILEKLSALNREGR